METIDSNKCMALFQEASGYKGGVWKNGKNIGIDVEFNFLMTLPQDDDENVSRK